MPKLIHSILLLSLVILAPQPLFAQGATEKLLAEAGRALESGDPNSAVKKLEQAAEIERSTLGEQHPQYAATLNNLGFARMAAGELKRAENAFLEALSIFNAASPADSARTALVLSNLGELTFRSRRYSEAKDYFKRALELRLSSPQQNDPALAVSYHNLAYAMSALGEYVEAIPLYEKALAISTRHFGPEHLETGHAHHNLGEALREVGSEAKAEAELKRALAIRETAKVIETEVTLLSLSELALAAGRQNDAEAYLTRAITLVEARTTPTSPDLVPLLEQLALVELSRNNLERSEELYRRALAIAGPSPSPALMSNLAFVLLQRGNYAEASEIYSRVVTEREASAGKNSAALVRPLRELARTKTLLKRPEEALALLDRAEKIQTAAAPRSTELVEIWSEMASSRSLGGDLKGAKSDLVRAHALAHEVYGPRAEETDALQKRLRDLERGARR